MSNRVAETTTCSASASPGEGVGEGSCPKQTLRATRSSAASRIGERARLGCWRARLAIANFAGATLLSGILAIRKDCFGAAPKPASETDALPGINQTGRFCITSYLQLRESDLLGHHQWRRIVQLSFFFLRRSFVAGSQGVTASQPSRGKSTAAQAVAPCN